MDDLIPQNGNAPLAGEANQETIFNDPIIKVAQKLSNPCDPSLSSESLDDGGTSAAEQHASAGGPPTASIKEIEVALNALFPAETIVELRAIYKRGDVKKAYSGYFDRHHRHAMAVDALRLNAQGAAIYVSLNPVIPSLLARSPNRIKESPASATNDKEIQRRSLLLVDLDPTRPANTSATSDKVYAANCKALVIRDFLSSLGWPEPHVAASGNGFHLLYPIDLPNEETSTALVKSVLKTLAQKFDDDVIKVDRSVHNAARICKLYGTVANKGDHTSANPWRLSELLQIGKSSPVTEDQLRKLVILCDKRHERTQPSVDNPSAHFNLEDFLQRHDIQYKVGRHDGRDRFKLERCPFNPDHVTGEAAIFRAADGKVGFKCMHDSCGEKHWRDVRQLLDGPDASNSINGASGAEEAWRKPTPLPDPLPPVDPFTADLLPNALRDWVMDIAHRMQCPPDFPAVAAMVALSSLIGARAVIQPKQKDDWQVVPNLWGAVVGRPGVKKSPALNEALKALRQLEAEELKKWQLEHHEWTMNCKVAEFLDEAKVKDAKKPKNASSKTPEEVRALLTDTVVPEEPSARRFLVNDATVEKLGEVMQKNEWGTLAYRDELYGLLTSLDRAGQEGSRSFYLTSYDGNQSYTFDRIIRGTVHVPRLCLAMIGGIQPGRIQEYVRGAVTGGNADDGLLQRFSMTVWPDVARAYVHVDQQPDLVARDSATSIFFRLAELPPDDAGLPTVWRFTPDAQTLFVNWLIDFEQEIRCDELHPAMVAHLSKYRKLIPALALVCAMCDEPDGGNLVSKEHLLRALNWCKYLRTHANRLYAAAVIPETAGAASLLRKIIDTKIGKEDPMSTSFTAREVAAKGWTGLGTVEQVRKAADLLADYGWLRWENVSAGVSGGRPSERYLINPAALQAAGRADGEVEGNLD